MKYVKLVTVLLFLTNYGFSQSDFRKGYIVKNPAILFMGTSITVEI